MKTEQLVATLREMADKIAAGDSSVGNISYTFPTDEMPQDDYDVKGAYRIGNSYGQGGLRIIG
jgi:hypothetical protein